VPEQKLPKKNKGFQISAKRNPTKIYQVRDCPKIHS